MKVNNAAPPVNSNKTNQNVAFKGIPQNIKKYVTEDLVNLTRQGTMSRHLFILNAFVFLLGSRLFAARDKKEPKTANNPNSTLSSRVKDYLRKNNEKRETLVRDVPTILIAVLGVPIFAKAVAHGLQKSTGFAIMGDGEQSLVNKILGNGKAGKDVVSYAQLEDWYRYDKNLASGFEGFAERLKGLNGNLKKIFSSLDDEIKNVVSGIKDDGDFLKNVLNDNVLKSKLEAAFSKAGNSALKKAEFLKTSTNLAGFAVTLALVGLFIPKFNIFLTEKINKSTTEQSEKKV